MPSSTSTALIACQKNELYNEHYDISIEIINASCLEKDIIIEIFERHVKTFLQKPYNDLPKEIRELMGDINAYCDLVYTKPEEARDISPKIKLLVKLLAKEILKAL